MLDRRLFLRACDVRVLRRSSYYRNEHRAAQILPPEVETDICPAACDSKYGLGRVIRMTWRKDRFGKLAQLKTSSGREHR